jgi:hypothetical protein
MVRFIQLLTVSCCFSLLCSGASGETKSKLKEEKKFGEDVILKMTEPPNVSTSGPATEAGAARTGSMQESGTPGAAVQGGTVQDTTTGTGTHEASKQGTALPGSGSVDSAQKSGSSPDPLSSAAPATSGGSMTDHAAAVNGEAAGLNNAVTSSAVPTAPQGQKPTRVLDGRIEQLIDAKKPSFPFGPDDLDTLLKEPAAKEKVLSNYPALFRGTWIGMAKIDEDTYSEDFQQANPALVKRERAILFPGRLGELAVKFEPNASGKIVDVHAQIVFRPTMDDAPYLDMIVKPAQGADPSAPMRIPATLKFIVKFGPARNSKDIVANTLNTEEILNRITQRSPSVVEQLIGIRTQTMNPSKSRISFGWVETVVRFQILSPSQILAHFASVHYAADGTFESKSIFHGTMMRVMGSELDKETSTPNTDTPHYERKGLKL